MPLNDHLLLAILKLVVPYVPLVDVLGCYRLKKALYLDQGYGFRDNGPRHLSRRALLIISQAMVSNLVVVYR